MEWWRGSTELFKGKLKLFARYSNTTAKNTCCRKLSEVVNEDCNDWDDRLSEVVLQLRIKPLRATGFSPSEMFHTWKFHEFPSEMSEHEENQLIGMIEQEDVDVETSVDEELQSTMQRFADVQCRVRDAAEGNIKKEKQRQKKSFDLRNLNHGEKVHPGMVILDQH